jgi:hypothetical protein
VIDSAASLGFVPEKKQTRSDHDAGTEKKRKGWYFVPYHEPNCDCPNQHEIEERGHRGRRREHEGFRPEVLPNQIGDSGGNK